MNCSVMVMTLNEGSNLSRCLDSLSWCDDVVVLDSYSTDNTESIAKKYENVRFVRNKFEGYASQRNFGLRQIEYSHEWLFMVDADEVVSYELALEIGNAISQYGDSCSLFRMRRKDYFFNKWLRRSSGYPTWFGRLMKISDVRIEREINEEYVTDGKQRELQEHLIHYPFSKGMSWWFERHNRYSDMEAVALYQTRKDKVKFSNLTHSDPVVRRKEIKALAYKLPGRPILMFFGLYFVRLGFLDGMAGLRFSIMRSIYEYMIDLKVKELEVRKRNE